MLFFVRRAPLVVDNMEVSCGSGVVKPPKLVSFAVLAGVYFATRFFACVTPSVSEHSAICRLASPNPLVGGSCLPGVFVAHGV